MNKVKKRAHTVQFHLYKILESEHKFIGTKHRSSVLGGKHWRGAHKKGITKRRKQLREADVFIGSIGVLA